MRTLWYLIAAGIAGLGPLAALARCWLNLRFLSQAYERGGVRDLRVASAALGTLAAAERRPVAAKRRPGT